MTEDEEQTVTARMLVLLAGVPEQRRLAVLAQVCQVVIERPEWLALVKEVRS